MDTDSPSLIDLFLRPFSTSVTLEAMATAVSVWSYRFTMAHLAVRSWQTKNISLRLGSV